MAARKGRLESPLAKILQKTHYRLDPWEAYNCMLTAIEARMGLTGYQDRAERDGKGRWYGRIDGLKTDAREIIDSAAETYLHMVADNEPWYDILGHTYMDWGTGNTHFGQFFTPWHVSVLMAAMTMGTPPARQPGDRLISVADPCCGAGVLLMASAYQIEKNEGYEALQHYLFFAGDKDMTCSRMTAIQFLANAVIHKRTVGEIIVIRQDSLLLDEPTTVLHSTAEGRDPEWGRFYSPASIAPDTANGVPAISDDDVFMGIQWAEAA